MCGGILVLREGHSALGGLFSETLDMSSEGMWEMLEGDFADTSAKIDGGRREPVKCVQRGSKDPDATGISSIFHFQCAILIFS
jgi:hypothetical protein